MLYVESLKKSFDGFIAVDSTNLSVEKGQIVAVIGPNGAGKTTLFRLITGHLKPDEGRILFDGENLIGLAPYEICRKGISLSFQVVNIFSRLSVFQNVQTAVLSYQKKSRRIFSPAATHGAQEAWEILNSVGLAAKAESISGLLSHGEQKVLEIAIALGNRPELLILDEPTAGMSPEETSFTIDLIHKLTGEMGLTILFCEHDMELVFSIADKIMVMQHGRSIIEASPEEVKESPEVQEAYLGGSG